MSIFETAVNDIFGVNDFIEKAIINGNVVDVICSAMPQGVAYTDVGLVDEENFTLKVKCPIPFEFTRGMNVIFHGKTYKLLTGEYDSAFTSYTLHLQSLSKA